MPIYEYKALTTDNACKYCQLGFEMIQGINEKPLKECPHCGRAVKKIISWCHWAVLENPDEHRAVKNKIRAYEKSGRWSHAAELADKHSEKIKDRNLKMRALANYQKAGHDADSLAKHVRLDDK